MDEKLLLWMWLAEVFGEANPRKWEATSRFDTIEECYYAYKHGDLYGLTYEESVKAQKITFDEASRTLEYCNENNINIYCYESEGFPDRLRNIYNPPSVLYAKHSTASLDFLDDNVVIGVVGSRNINDYYARVTADITAKLAQAGAVVVSGFAVGTDTCAHRAALENGGKTVAVLGSGINYDYPKDTSVFKAKIAENGAVISEYPPDTPPNHVSFKARNRILTGISLGLLITQAGVKSGALNSAANAVAQGKDLFCVPPHDVFDDNCKGVVNLIRDGAVPVFDARDVLYEYYENYSHKLSYSKTVGDYQLRTEDSAVFSKKSAGKNSSAVKKAKKKSEISDEMTVENTETERVKNEIDLEQLSEAARKIVSALEGKEMLADEISRETDLDVSELYGELTELELSGIVRSLPGNRYTL